MSKKGSIQIKEHKIKRGIYNSRIFSEEHLRNLRNTHPDRSGKHNSMYGKKRPDLSAYNRSEKHHEACRNSFKLKNKSAEARKNMSIARRGYCKTIKGKENRGEINSVIISPQRLVCVIMGQNCEKFIDMCLESVKDADAIVYCDGGSNDGTLGFLHKRMFTDIKNNIFAEFRSQEKDIIHNEYNQEDKQMNGKQRNFYLEYVKKKFPGYWCLALDADEVVDDGGIKKLKEWINKYNSISDLYPCVSVKMRHFIGDLGHEDAMQQEHFVPHRLFKVCEDLEYPLVEHPVLQCKNKEDKGYVCRETTIFHLAYIPNLWEIKNRYENHLKKSNMHTPEFLFDWYMAHLTGQYPKSQIELTDIPAIIWNKFGIDKDILYFKNRGLETKHFVMTRQWIDYFIKETNDGWNDEPLDILEFGSGRAPYGYAIKSYGQNYDGIELSQYAVNNAFVPIKQGDITTYSTRKQYDLILCIDVLEHLSDEQLNQAMINILQHGDNFLFSVPVIGDPNLLNDKTHKQFKSKEEWIQLWESYGIKIIPTPDNWLFKEQLFIGERK